MLIFFFISILHAEITPLSECRKGKTTYYATYANEEVACMLGNDYPANIYRAAPNQHFYSNSKQ